MEIFETQNYDQFKIIKGNRDISPLHVDGLAKSIEKRNMLASRPMIVNRRLEVIDGQHRLAAARLLGLSIFYVIDGEADFEEVAQLNSSQSNWTLKDYLKVYANQGYPHYKKLSEFTEKEEISIEISLEIMIQKSDKRKTDLIKDFKSGYFVFEEDESIKTFIMYYKKLQTHVREKSFKTKRETQFTHRKSFIAGFLKFCNHFDFAINWEMFFYHVDAKIETIVAKATTAQYFDLFKNLYNWRRRGTKKDDDEEENGTY